MIIYRSTDRIPVKIGEIKFWISPLSYAHKQRLASFTRIKGGEVEADQYEVMKFTLRACLKKVEGLQLADGSPYELEFDEAGLLTEDCMGDVLELQCNTKLLSALADILSGSRESRIEGVEIDFGAVEVSKKKPTGA